MKTLKIITASAVLAILLLLLAKDILITKQFLCVKSNLTTQPYQQTSVSAPASPTLDSANAKAYCELAERNFKASEGIFSSIQWTHTFTIAFITLFITLFGILGFNFVLPKILNKQIRDWANNSVEFKKIKKDIQENSREMNIALTQVYITNGLSRWKEGVLERAIEQTEKAQVFFRKACPRGEPRAKDDQILWGTLCGNLSYYYAESKNHAKYDEALKCAKIALTIGKKYHIMNLVENFPYVIKQYDMKNPLLKKEAKELVELYKQDLLKIPGMKPEEITAYERYFSQ